MLNSPLTLQRWFSLTSRVHRKPKCDNIAILTNLSTLITKIIVAKLNSSLAQERWNLIVLSRYDDSITRIQGYTKTPLYRCNVTSPTTSCFLPSLREGGRLVVKTCTSVSCVWVAGCLIAFPSNAKFSLCWKSQNNNSSAIVDSMNQKTSRSRGKFVVFPFL